MLTKLIDSLGVVSYLRTTKIVYISEHNNNKDSVVHFDNGTNLTVKLSPKEVCKQLGFRDD